MYFVDQKFVCLKSNICFYCDRKDTFLGGQLCPLSIGQQHGGGVGLEPSYRLGFSSLSYHIHCLESNHHTT